MTEDTNRNGHEAAGTRAHQPSIAEAGPFTVSRTEHARNTILPTHSHAHSTLTLVLGGGYNETVDGTTYHLPSMSVIVKPALTDHSNVVDSQGARCLLLELPVENLGRMSEGTTVFQKTRVARLSRGADLALGILGTLRRRATNSDRLLLESLTMELAALVAIETKSLSVREPAAWLERVRERLHDSITAPSLADLAMEAGCHPMHLTRMFRRVYGESVGAYARQVRLTRAARAIATRRGTLSQIAVLSGFYDHSHLTHEFQARTGLTPAEWRNLANAS